jgi:hypothetical protein
MEPANSCAGDPPSNRPTMRLTLALGNVDARWKQSGHDISQILRNDGERFTERS